MKRQENLADLARQRFRMRLNWLVKLEADSNPNAFARLLTEKAVRRFIAETGITSASAQPKETSRGTRWYVVYNPGAGSRSAIPDFVDLYMADVKSRSTPDTWRNYEHHLVVFRDWCKVNGLNRLGDITRLDMNTFMNWLPGTLTATTRRRYMETVRAAFNQAVDWEMIQGNPCARLRMPPNRQTIQRRCLTDEEIAVIQRDWEMPVREWSMLGIWAGLRRSEATYLAWSDVDFDRGLIAVTAKPDVGFQPKGTRYRDGEPDLVPLVPWLAEALTLLPQAGRFVFDTGDDRPLWIPDRWWRTVRSEAVRTGLSGDITPHVFRHTFVTKLALAGVQRPLVSVLARHLNQSTTDRYVHPTFDDAATAIKKLAPVLIEF